MDVVVQFSSCWKAKKYCMESEKHMCVGASDRSPTSAPPQQVEEKIIMKVHFCASEKERTRMHFCMHFCALNFCRKILPPILIPLPTLISVAVLYHHTFFSSLSHQWGATRIMKFWRMQMRLEKVFTLFFNIIKNGVLK